MKKIRTQFAILSCCVIIVLANAQQNGLRPVSSITSNDIETEDHHLNHECELCQIEDCRTPSSFECLAGMKITVISTCVTNLSNFMANYWLNYAIEGFKSCKLGTVTLVLLFRIFFWASMCQTQFCTLISILVLIITATYVFKAMFWTNVDVAKFVGELSMNCAILFLEKVNMEFAEIIWFVEQKKR